MVKHLALLLFFIILDPLPAATQVKPMTTPTEASNRYTLADLKILFKESNYFEFFEHCLDLRPTLRTQEWKEMVTQMGAAYLQLMLKQQTINRDTIQIVEKISRIPVLRKDEFFLRYRSQIGQAYFQRCLEGKDPKSCHQDFVSFWKNLPPPGDISLQMGNLIRLKGIPIDPWFLYEVAAKSSFADYYCKDENLRRDLGTRLYNELQSTSDHQKIKKTVNDLMSPECWKVLQTEYLAGLKAPQQVIREFSYHILLAMGSLDMAQKNLALTVHLLNTPQVGKRLNQAWNLVDQMGSDFKKRSELLKELLQIDPLPGKVFAAQDKLKRKTLLSHLYKNMPEYMDHYAKTCLDFLYGRKTFENGNPTPECRQLFEAAKGTKWISSQLVEQYQNHPRL